MAIQVRRGNEADFDASKMLPGEWAVSLDTRYVRMCFAPGLVLRMATYEAFEADRAQIQAILAECEDIQTAIERIQGEVNSNAALTVEGANSAKESADRAHGEAERALSEADRAHSEADKAHSEAERAKSYMDGAESVIGVEIADLYQTKAGAIIEKASGESPLCIRDTADNLVRNLRLYGNTEQDGTSGKNLLKINFTSKEKNGVTYTANADRSITANGVATGDASIACSADTLPPGTYTVSGCPIGGDIYGDYDMYFHNTGTEEVIARDYDGATAKTFTLTETTTVGGRLRVRKGYNASNLTFYPMIRLESITDDTYEPYTGGQPSPNPEYPQEIRSVVVNEVKAHGKNLIPISEYTTNSVGTHIYMVAPKLDSNKKYILSGSTNDGIALSSNVCQLIWKDKNNNTIVTSSAQSWKSGGASYGNLDDAVQLEIYTANTLANKTIQIQLEEGTVATAYEPYTENPITLSQPIELNRGDVLTPDAVNRKFAKVVFDGSSNDGTWTTVDLGDGWYRHIVAPTIFNKSTDSKKLSNKYVYYANYTDKSQHFYVGSGLYVFDQMTHDNFLASLAEENLVIVGELATPIIEPLPTADQIALRSLLSYDGVTYLEVDCDVVVPTIEAECVLDTKRYIDRKFAELAAALV